MTVTGFPYSCAKCLNRVGDCLSEIAETALLVDRRVERTPIE